jgi:hypothetical protein
MTVDWAKECGERERHRHIYKEDIVRIGFCIVIAVWVPDKGGGGYKKRTVPKLAQTPTERGAGSGVLPRSM